MQYWQMVGKRVVHPEFGAGKCVDTDDGNIAVRFDNPHPVYGDVVMSIQHTSVILEPPNTVCTPTNGGLIHAQAESTPAAICG